MDQRLRQIITQMAKIELHVHLEGSISPPTAIALMQRNNPSAPAKTEQDIRHLYRFGNLGEFVQAMRSVSNNIMRLEDLTLVADELLAELVSQSVRYVEIDCAVQKYIDLGFELGEIVTALFDSAVRAERGKGIVSKLVINLQRHHGDEKNRELVERVVRLNHPFIVGVGLSGDETQFPQKLFARTFSAAREAGLHRTVHAGEALPPASIWDAINYLFAERIDHGTTACQDASLMAYLVEHRIALTQCLSSNLQLKVVENIQQHPFADFLRRGMLVSLHTDDPQVFNTCLNDEYLLAAESFGLTFDEMKRIVMNAASSSFLPEAEKQALIKRIDGELFTLSKIMAQGHDL